MIKDIVMNVSVESVVCDKCHIFICKKVDLEQWNIVTVHGSIGDKKYHLCNSCRYNLVELLGKSGANGHTNTALLER